MIRSLRLAFPLLALGGAAAGGMAVGGVAAASSGGDGGIQFILREAAVERAAPEDKPASVESDAWGGAVVSSYSLSSSSGNSVKLAPALGSSLGAALSVRLDESRRLTLIAEKVEVRYSTVSGYTSAPLRTRHYDGRFGPEFHAGKFMFRPGYRIHLREVQETGQSALMTKAVMHGLDLTARYSSSFSTRWRSAVFAGLFAPISYDEKFQSTGASGLRFGAEAGGGIFYDWSRKVHVGFTPAASVFLTRFKGASARSVANARERWFQAKFPLEVGYAF